MEPLNEKRIPIHDILAAREVPTRVVSKKIEAPIILSKPRAAWLNFFGARRRFRFNVFNGFGWKIALGAIVLVVAGGIAVGVFSSVTVTIAERTESAHIDTLIAAGKGADVALEFVSVDGTAGASGKSSGVEDVASRAAGRIVIYNAYGIDSQQLVRRTRFSAPDGKVFRLKETVTVPGATMVNGKLEASSLEVDVVADQPGDAYNIDLADFTIPGFKGSAKYEKFYARSKTPMTGGFIGRAAVVRDEDVAAVRQSLERELRNKLDTAFAAKLALGFVVPDGAFRYDIAVTSVEPPSGARGDSFEVRLTGMLAGLSVKRADVEQVLALKYGKAADGVSPEIEDFDGLALKTDKPDFEKKTMVFTAKGDANFVWAAPVDDLKKELVAAAGASGRTAVFAAYPQIRRASVSYHPSWWRIFPKQEGRIIVQESAHPAE